MGFAGFSPVFARSFSFNHTVRATLFLALTAAAASEAARQPGKDGPLTVAAAGTIVNTYAVLAADAPAGSSSISVNVPGGPNDLNPATLTASDLLLMIQMMGATIDTTDTPSYGTVTNFNNAGRWEFVTVSDAGFGGPPNYTIPLDGYLKNSYTATARVQILRVPQYASLTINPGGSITAAPWVPVAGVLYGGIVAIDVQNTAALDGDIDVSGLGFWGGALSGNGAGSPTIYRSTNPADGGEKGVSIAGFQGTYDSLGGRYGRGAPSNGGGGGNAHDAGGGGGANAWNALPWTGQGNPDRGPGNIYDDAWNLDPSLSATSTSSGGGRGGYSWSDADLDPRTVAPGDAAWAGDFRREVGGRGGRPLLYDSALSRIFFGGGGGSGSQTNGFGGAGGRGGGIVFLYANTVTGAGNIVASGEAGGDTTGSNFDGAGGGGGGGAVVVQARTAVTLGAITATGGDGGSQGLPPGVEGHGVGGGGGGGFVYVCAPSVSAARNAAGGANGITASTALTEFPPNGATRGADGTADAGDSCIGSGPPALTFTNVTSGSNLGTASIKDGGLAWGDFNSDGCPDVLVNTFDSGTFLYSQDVSAGACAGTFTDRTLCLAPGLASVTDWRSVVWGDYDNDGFLDFARNQTAAIEVYRNGGPGAACMGWAAFTLTHTLSSTPTGFNTEGMGFIDYDADGDLDLVAENGGSGIAMFRNDPTGTLAYFAVPGLPTTSVGNGDYAAVADFDADGDVDLVARKEDGATVWVNGGGGSFSLDPASPEVATGGNKGGVAFCDLDNDGDFDLLWTDALNGIAASAGAEAWRNDGVGGWTNFPLTFSPAPSGGENIDGVACGDIDNDGDLDLAFTNGANDYLLRNDGAFTFVNVTPASFGANDSEGITFADYDRDGDLDLLMNQDPANELWRNEANDKNYLMVRALHDVDGSPGGVTRDAIGATIWLRSCSGSLVSPGEEVNGGQGHGSQDPAYVHFGLRRSSLPSGPSSPYVVRVQFVGGAVVQRAVVPSSLGCYQLVTIASTDATDLSACAATSVELVSFASSSSNEAVELSWQTGSELDNLGFNLYRALSEAGPYARITSRLIPGLGSSPEGARYRYLDSGLSNGTTYFYKLEDVDTTGKTTLHGPVSATPSSDAPPPVPAPQSQVTYGNPGANIFRVLRQGPQGVVLELTTEGFYAESLPDGTVRIEIPGFESAAELGIPVLRPWVELPGGKDASVASVETSGVESFTTLRPSGADVPEIVATRRGTVRAGRQPRRASLETFGFYPENAARLLQVGFQGDAKKAQLELAPLRWNGSTGELVLARRLTVNLAFRGIASKVVKRSRRARNILTRLVTTERGLYEVRFEDLFSRGKGVAADRLRLTRLGEPVALHLEPAGRRFGPGSRLYFLSEGSDANPYGSEAVYELEARGGGGALMELGSARPRGDELSGYLQTDDYEQNRFYQAGLLDAPDLWLWDVLLAPVVKSFPFQVTDLREGPSRLTLWLQGVSDLPIDPDHHVKLYVNGVLQEELHWDGKEARTADLEPLPGVLREGENRLEIENTGDTGAPYSMVMLDRFRMVYPRAASAAKGSFEGVFPLSGTASVEELPSALLLDVTDEAPRWLIDGELSGAGGIRFRTEAGRRYLAVSPEAVLRPLLRNVAAPKLKKDALRADFLVVGPKEFASAAEALLNHRRGQGLQTIFAAVEDIYSEFGFGEARPEAIRDFLSYAYHRWQEPRLRYVLLLGDATYDFKDYLRTGVANRLPPLMVKTSYLWTVSDPALAAINGDDVLPDVAIGRLPAKDTEEVRGMVSKILDYETGEASLERLMVLVTDNSDGGGDFVGNADEIAGGVLSSRPLRRISIAELGGGARTEILRAFDEGASLVSYIGHGGIHLWADENVLNVSDAASLSPQPQQPLLITMNCLNGYFHFPYFDSLAEALLKTEGRGAIAAFSPSGLSLNEPAHRFHQALLDAVFRQNHPRLGDAVLAAQGAYADSGAFPELVRIYHLLGDPALVLRELPRRR
jgi:hypothetical protein